MPVRSLTRHSKKKSLKKNKKSLTGHSQFQQMPVRSLVVGDAKGVLPSVPRPHVVDEESCGVAVGVEGFLARENVFLTTSGKGRMF